MEQWCKFFDTESDKPYYKELMRFIDSEYSSPDILHRAIFPPRDEIFRAFNACSMDKIKVVILGQDPYHEEGQANGLAFSVNEGVKIPPSLRNIFIEVGQSGYKNGDLSQWAKDGVLLLNTVLTVRESSAKSHSDKGWEQFTDSAISFVNEHADRRVCFMLWGRDAQQKTHLIDSDKHYVISTSHPSPLSARRSCGLSPPFIGSNCFMVVKAISGVDFNTADFSEI